MMNRTKPSSHQFKSFLIKDILGSANVEIPQGKNNDGDSQLKKESIRKWDALKKRKQCFATEKSQCGKGTTTRAPFQNKQRQILEQHFQESKYVTQKERKKIANEINLTDQQVKIWFQNRRTRWRKANGNEGLAKGSPFEDCKERIRAGKILSNFTEKLSRDCVNQLHKQLTEN